MIAIGAPKATRRKWIALAVIALPRLHYSMGLTVPNFAAAVERRAQARQRQLLWIVDIDGFLISVGTPGDRIGRLKPGPGLRQSWTPGHRTRRAEVPHAAS